MLQIKKLSLTHRKDLRPLISELTFSLQPGERIAVIGEEGNGKSTLLKALYDRRLVEPYAECSGEVLWGSSVAGYLAQEFPPAELCETVYDWISEKPGFWDASPKELAQIGRQMHLSPEFFYSDQKIATLSGGEKVKLQVAALLLLQPDVLLLDEPSNDLDLDTLIWLEEWMKSAPQAMIYISHDETLLERTATGILHLELLRRKTMPRWTLFHVDYRTYLEQRSRAFAHQEQQARKEEADYQKQMVRFRQIESRVEHQQSTVSRQDPHTGRLLKKKMHAVKSMGKRLEQTQRTQLPESEEAILVRFDPTITVPQGKRVLDWSLSSLEADGRCLAKDLSLTVVGPQHIGIIGANGCGKTTLLRLLAKELLSRTDLHAFWMPQRYEEAIDPSMTPVEFLCKTGEREEESRVRTYLGSMKYTPQEMDHPFSSLSGGQKAKLFFVKINLERANVLLLDEPTRNFSPLSNPVLRQELKNFGGCILSVSHDRKYLQEVCTKWYRFTKNGLIPVDWNEIETN